MELNTETQKEEVKEYYGTTLQSTEDLKTNACCTDVSYPDHIKKALSKIHDEVMSKYYGCGLTVPESIVGCSVLDLGSGSGRDCYLLSQLVGEQGSVLGVDMTPEQLDVSLRHIDFHKEAFNYSKSNVNFLKGDLEHLEELNLKENSLDVVISNCVINLVPNKKAVLEQIFKLLKPGGEMYFADVYCDRRIPEELVKDPVLYGECLSGALYWNDFENLARQVGFVDPRVVTSRPITIENKSLEARVKNYKFYSTTYRLFKLENLDPQCEDYGQAVCYKGGVEASPDAFVLDDHHTFVKGKVMTVCGNTYRMLQETRFSEHFDFYGTFDQHYGLYDCGPTSVSVTESFSLQSEEPGPGCC